MSLMKNILALSLAFTLANSAIASNQNSKTVDGYKVDVCDPYYDER
ncbi:Uncharacterised protein [Moraxella lacunata]|uniref:Uncharacterized protein n=1 Tax=Moraxella lacunata TaxID=477 RepID=A0A378QER4_MORLA|nr:hypothetical protein [Moraxella lacunata]STY99406.1 Uncharacterised protein [Moraxella lacunata]